MICISRGQDCLVGLVGVYISNRSSLFWLTQQIRLQPSSTLLVSPPFSCTQLVSFILPPHHDIVVLYKPPPTALSIDYKMTFSSTASLDQLTKHPDYHPTHLMPTFYDAYTPPSAPPLSQFEPPSPLETKVISFFDSILGSSLKVADMTLFIQLSIYLTITSIILLTVQNEYYSQMANLCIHLYFLNLITQCGLNRRNVNFLLAYLLLSVVINTLFLVMAYEDIPHYYSQPQHWLIL